MNNNLALFDTISKLALKIMDSLYQIFNKMENETGKTRKPKDGKRSDGVFCGKSTGCVAAVEEL